MCTKKILKSVVAKLVSVESFVFLLAWLLGCSESTSKNQYILAERLFSDRKYVAAVDEFQKIVDNDLRTPIGQQALFRVAVIQLLYLSDYSESVKNFKKFSFISKNEELVYQADKTIAEIYFSKLEDYRLAIEQYKRLLEKYPKSQEKDFFLFRLGKAYYSTFEFDQAMHSYRELYKEYPKSLLAREAMYQIANTYYTKGDIDAALNAFEDVVALYPGSPEAIFSQYGIGNCYEEKNKIGEALEIYKKIQNKHPSRQVVEAKIRRLSERKTQF